MAGTRSDGSSRVKSKFDSAWMPPRYPAGSVAATVSRICFQRSGCAALRQAGRDLLGPHPAVRCERMREAHDRCLFGSGEVVMDAAAGEVKQHVGESQALQAGEKVSRWTLQSIGVRGCGWSGGAWPKVE